MTHFTTTEDEALIYGWVIASNDPINGKDKKGAIFWWKIIEDLNKRIGPNGTQRDKRCNTLRTEVRRYVSHVRPYFRNKPSGLNEHDYYRRGQQNYEAEFGRLWKHESVFQILKTYQPDYNSAVNNDDGADISCRRRYFEQTNDVRSAGRDQAKKRAREAKASQKAHEKMDKLIELLENAQAQRVSKYETEEEYQKKNMENSSILAQTQQREADMKILRQNLNKLEDWEKPLYKIWKNEIFARHGLPLIP
ncbi:uncharacterized protein LOC113312971 [Papaver somniferum]|uniref:uncharacterized protein LOC113312971 n=1 Tax=Papaver somniferum TaxID=3469 RepID=UPI000E705D31|nr:uncharacterized protein LOC113312971 [Papaver somniferum]